ncbi:sugar nucleotide-binding protein [Microbacterium sulfonylureivorans]|uniref:sugar nucleotide-binding protein n=1 Tax=Microbacterium sulfonylureivorans TaxID=2486854 RepID=UPI001F0BB19D|nr:bifunctional dTDP-4-dehydrorhamnose 3,5-epimerase family protein/NAD(P)-dependent oxidoreductase [Microbacterium sulfonylureivorans]
MAAASLRITHTEVPGLLVAELPVHADSRGWFKENWQREKMTAAGLPDFGPVQHNISFNAAVGTTRGIHAEPWDKWVSVACGRVFGAWVDLREGPTFGARFTIELDPSRAVFVPRGVGNAYQTLEAGTAYSYLVNDHWSPDAEYSFLNLADETADIPWPIALTSSEISEKDRAHPRLRDVVPLPPRRMLVVGAGGQLGSALRTALGTTSHIEFADRSTLDVTDPAVLTARRWRDYSTIVNAAAFTSVDRAETPEGRRLAWNVNVGGAAHLARIAIENGLTLVHISSDYVFDGTSQRPYLEDDALSPLGVYGQTKAAADAVVSTVPRHYILRTSWVIGEGANFVRTMRALADRGVDPAVVDDQIGRLTFTADLARAIELLLTSRADFGVYNVTGGGPPMTWADIARAVFTMTGHDPARVRRVSTADYSAGASTHLAPRPLYSVLDLDKITRAGFTPADARASLASYLDPGSAPV